MPAELMEESVRAPVCGDHAKAAVRLPPITMPFSLISRAIQSAPVMTVGGDNSSGQKAGLSEILHGTGLQVDDATDPTIVPEFVMARSIPPKNPAGTGRMCGEYPGAFHI